MCALLCADSKISPQANGACVCATDHVLMYAQKLDSCTRPTHCVGSEQLVQMCALGHFRIQSWGARAWFLRMRIQPSLCVRNWIPYADFSCPPPVRKYSIGDVFIIHCNLHSGMIMRCSSYDFLIASNKTKSASSRTKLGLRDESGDGSVFFVERSHVLKVNCIPHCY